MAAQLPARAAVAALLLAGFPASVATAHTAAARPNSGRTTICHRTPAAKRPYSRITVSAAQLGSHLEHPSDVVPAPRRGCPTVVLAPSRGGVAFHAALSGSNEPSGHGDRDGTGVTTVRLRRGEGRVCFQTNVANIHLPAFASHIHFGTEGQTGPVVVTLRAPDESGSASGCVTVARRLVAGILARPASLYVNVHNAEFEESAVRGQLR